MSLGRDGDALVAAAQTPVVVWLVLDLVVTDDEAGQVWLWLEGRTPLLTMMSGVSGWYRRQGRRLVERLSGC